MRKKRIWLDAGHGGADPGAVGNGMQEKEINLDIVLRIGSILSADFDVNYSRTDDRAVTNRAQNANAWGADIFVSIHVNAFGQDSANGTEAFIFDNGSERARQSRNLASNIQSAFVTRLGTRDRGVKLDGQSQHSGGLGVLRNSTMPATLFELAFITAASQFRDVGVLRNRRDDMAAAIVEGVYNYFGMKQSTPKLTINELTPIAGTLIAGTPIATAEQMRAYIKHINPDAPDLAKIYIREGLIEGIRGDIAFALSCVETGNFTYRGSAVTPEQNNFGGLGVIENGMRGSSFPSAETGVRAIIHHLKAYANDEPLVNENQSPRFRFVQRGVAPFVEWLGIQENPQGRGWATGAGYGEKILNILGRIIATDAPNVTICHTPEEITVNAAIAAGIITDRCHWLGVLSGRITPVPAYIKIMMDNATRKITAQQLPLISTTFVPYLVRVQSGEILYDGPNTRATNKTISVGVYTIVEEINGRGRLKSGAGWIDLSTTQKVQNV